MSAKISLENTPTLTHVPASYVPWRSAIEVVLELAGCWNAVLGLDVEPSRTGWMNNGIIGQVRTIRAGSAAPTPEETASARVMTADEKIEWDKWQAR
jgi:hypothetical protein